MPRPRLLLGTNAFAASGDGARRQAGALASWVGLDGVELANLQWPDAPFPVPGFPTEPVLAGDSVRATGRAGARKPLAREVMDRLCALAEARGCRWFAYANSDVRVTQGAVDAVLAGGREGYAFSRADVDPEDGRVLDVTVAGVDLVAVEAAWWRRNARRFRPYVLGEPVWDNVYTAVLLCHADAVLLNRDPLLLHERHAPGAWDASPFAEYTRWMVARDRPYFTLWAHYHHHLLALRARGAPEAEEAELQRRVFRFAPTPGERVVQALRVAKAGLRFAVRRGRDAGPAPPGGGANGRS
jgi:hypothetical protein